MGMRAIANVEDPIASDPIDHDATAVYQRAPAVMRSSPPERRLHDVTARLRDRLAAVRPAMSRLRSVLPGAQGVVDARHRDFVELASADVLRALVQARRSVRALAAELADLEAESRDLLAIAASIEARR